LKTRSRFAIVMILALLVILPICSAQEEEENLERIIIRELYVTGHEKMSVTSRSLILTGNMTVRNQSELFIAGSKIQLSIRGEKTYNITTLNNGTMTASNSTLDTLSPSSIVRISDNSTMKLINSNLKGFKELCTYNASSLDITGGRFDIAAIKCAGKEVSIIGGNMPQGELNINTTKARLEKFKGDRVLVNVNKSLLTQLECNLLRVNTNQSVNLNNSKIGQCFIQSAGEIITADSSFTSLTMNSSGVAVNVTTATAGGRSGGAIYTGLNATVKRYWYLKVNVTEMTGIGIPAKVIVEDYFGNVTATGKSEPEGLFNKPILAEIINATRTLFLGNYKVKAEYKNHTTRSVTIVLDKNMYLELRFTESVPIDSPTTMKISPTTVKVDEPVKIEGWLNGKQPNELVEINMIGPSDLRTTTASMTNQIGNFSLEFTPKVEGRWIFYADWIGGPRYGERYAKSQALVLTVEPRPSILVLLIQALPIAVVVLGIIAGMAFLAISRSRGSRI